MCGICGNINFDNKPVDQDILVRMMDSMHHRGPDEEGLYLDGFIGLGHRRLSIIDLRGGRQPIANEDGSVIIVYNGEIYNFQELREGLIAKGHVFKTNTDTEVIVHLYEEKGVECLEEIRGMFAFAIWDKKKQILFLARDRLGIKPFYYYENKNSFLFASEIKALFECQNVIPELNEKALVRYLRYRFVYGSETLFKGVYELPPGQYMVVGKNLKIKRTYWNLSFSQNCNASQNELKEHLLAKLEESVRLRMISDVPIGVFLSGGVDSSAITALMSRNAQRIKTFSIGFKPEELNELKFSRAVAEHFQTEHHEYLLESGDFFQLLRKLIWHHDEPLIFPASIPLYILSKHSKNDATVMLAGEGADELFAGYVSNVKAYWLHRFSGLLPLTIKNKLLRLPLNSKYKSIMKKSTLPEYQLIPSFFQLFSPKDILRIYGRSNPDYINDDTLLDEIGFDRIKGSFLDKLLYFQIKTYLVALLIKQDKMSMAASIETRVPFLDHHLVELAFRIPDGYKIRLNQGKYILKNSCEGLLPKNIIYRKKMGFPVPIDKWFREKNNPFLDVLLDTSTKKRSFLNYGFIKKEVENFYHGTENSTHRLWALLNIELWRREFLEAR
jgi:asparagine synthase (glutamine-hydrolysing)